MTIKNFDKIQELQRNRKRSDANSGNDFFDKPAARSKNLLERLVNQSIVLREDLEKLPEGVRDTLRASGQSTADLLDLLLEHGLITEFQADRIESDATFGLVLGNYRVLDRLGSGGMGVVFKAEHIYMRRLAAIKALSRSLDQNPIALQRFCSEMRAVAQLKHPNIVAAFDAGRLESDSDYEQGVYYFVMEYVAGADLERYVQEKGPLPLFVACDLAHQIAAALAEAQKHQLVHRDIKPSNIIVTSEQQAMLLDFGLALTLDNRMTDPGTVLGTLDYLAPEQAKDASAVDIRADIYGLGGILFWSLTGRGPFPSSGNMVRDLACRANQAPPSIRDQKSEISLELDAILKKMLATRPQDRYQTPLEVQAALLPYLRPEMPEHVSAISATMKPSVRSTFSEGIRGTTQMLPPDKRAQQVLVIDDDPVIRNLCRIALQSEKVNCDEASDGPQALAALTKKAYDLLLLDIHMPGMTGIEVSRQVRKAYHDDHLKIILFSGEQSPDEMAGLMASGVDDFLTKPFSVVQLCSRVKSGLRLKEAQDRMAWLNQHMSVVNRQLEENLDSREHDLVTARNSLLMSLARLAELREHEDEGHVIRMRGYCRCLAETAAKLPSFSDEIDETFVRILECCAALHDIGKIALPDHILLKPGKFDDEERILMQTHTTCGAEILHDLLTQSESTLSILPMAVEIARHHHERFDGSGYPDRLTGTDIPLSARLASIADVYDALRSQRKYKPALSHMAAVHVMTEASKGQFDPDLIKAFQECAGGFEKIFADAKESK